MAEAPSIFCILGTVNAVLFLKSGLETIASFIHFLLGRGIGIKNFRPSFTVSILPFAVSQDTCHPIGLFGSSKDTQKLYRDSYWSMKPHLHNHHHLIFQRATRASE